MRLFKDEEHINDDDYSRRVIKPQQRINLSLEAKMLIFFAAIVLAFTVRGVYRLRVRHIREVVNSEVNITNRHIRNNIYRLYDRLVYDMPPFAAGGGLYFPYGEVPLTRIVSSRLGGECGQYVYAFRPGTAREEIEAVIGVNDRRLPEVVSYGYSQLIVTMHRESLLRLICSTVGIRHFYEGIHLLANIHEEASFVFDFGDFSDSPYVQLYRNDPHNVRLFRCGATDKIVVQLIQNPA